jgi:hypothetical protein
LSVQYFEIHVYQKIILAFPAGTQGRFQTFQSGSPPPFSYHKLPGPC